MSKDTPVEVKVSKIKPEVLELAAKIEASTTVDKKTGLSPDNLTAYNENIPEHLSVETVTDVHNYDDLFITAGTYVADKLWIDAMKGNKSLQEGTTKFAMAGKNTLEVNVQRSKSFANPLVKDSEPVVKYGVNTVKYDVQGVANRGQMKVIRNEMAEYAMAHLSK